MSDFYIIDLRPEWLKNPYITLWRPNCANYAYPLPWAGKYDKATVDASPGYFANKRGGSRYINFPVPCDVVESLAIPKPASRIIDGDAGPVLVNNAKTRAALRRARYVPSRSQQGEG